jgi:LysM repeat protein
MMDSNLRLVMGAAVVGIFLGVAGLVFGIVSKNKADELRNDFSQVQFLVEKIQQVEESSTGISASATRIRRELDGLREGTQGALDQVSTELTRLRRDLNDSIALARGLEEKLVDLRRPPAPAPVAVPASPPEAVAENGAVAGAGSTPAGEVHVIRAGDTLTAVASRHGISLARLMEVNPDINPNRLQIGQEIRLPPR